MILTANLGHCEDSGSTPTADKMLGFWGWSPGALGSASLDRVAARSSTP